MTKPALLPATKTREWRLKEILLGPLVALEFLTVLRLRPLPRIEAGTVARSQAYFPLIGALLGLALVAADKVLTRGLPPAAVAALMAAMLAALTGGLHLDGLMDSADGLFGGASREERLAIMRDAHVGSFGLLALVCLLLLRWSAFASLAAPGRLGSLMLAPVLSRWGMVLAIAAFPYARPLGLGRGWREAAWPVALPLATLMALAAALLLFGLGGLAPLALAGVLALALGLYAQGRLGGLTGDVYGAILEVTEVAVLLFLLWGSGSGWLRPLFWEG